MLTTVDLSIVNFTSQKLIAAIYVSLPILSSGAGLFSMADGWTRRRIVAMAARQKEKIAGRGTGRIAKTKMSFMTLAGRLKTQQTFLGQQQQQRDHNVC